MSPIYEMKPLEKMNDAIVKMEEEFAATSDNNRPALITNMVKLLTWRYMCTRAMKDIDEAILWSERLTMIRTTRFDRASCLSNLGNLLAWKYERTGALGDIHRAVLRTEEALVETSYDDPNRAGRLSNLANWLGRRFERNGSMDDLQRAISHSMEAVESTPHGHPYEASRLSSLGNWLARRHERTGNTDDLRQAARRAKEALYITPENHVNRPAYLASLGNIVALKFRLTNDPEDKWRAIRHIERALMSTPANSLIRTDWLNNLGTILAWSYERTHIFDDLKDAILCIREALGSMSHDHPNRAASLITLGDLLYCSYDYNGRQEDITECLSCYKTGWVCYNAPPIVRIRAAHKAANILLNFSNYGNWEEPSNLLNEAVRLLPRLSLYSLKQQDQQHMLSKFAGLATLAVSALLGNLGKDGAVRSLQLLELGRGVIAWLRFDILTDFVVLRRLNPEIVEIFERFPKISDYASYPPLAAAGKGEMLPKPLKTSPYHDAVQLEKVTREIHQLSSVKNISLLLTELELKSMASSGPVVVINVSSFRCDALLLEADAIRSITLPDLHEKDIARNVELIQLINSPTERFSRPKINILPILEWLWDAVMGPILRELGFREPPADGKWPHVWWIPTGLLSLLPLHAAGYHNSTSFETVIDRVISSYSPSIRSLLHARRKSISLYRVPGEVLFVSMDATPGCPNLSRAEDEIVAIEKLLPASALGKTLKRPSKADVINSLRTCDVFHFAGHSIPDPRDPSRSGLLLSDWQDSPLTVEDLIDLKRHDTCNYPFLAYLSACSTGVSSAERLHDESINLMTACQLAGFRHTIGSLWGVYDSYSVDAAKEFYKALGSSTDIDDKAVALAVHLAARYIRETTKNGEHSAYAGDPMAWAAYIHMGP